MKLFHENPIFKTLKSKMIISLFETVGLSVSISPRNLYNSLKSIKEIILNHRDSYLAIPWQKYATIHFNSSLLYFRTIVQQLTYQVNFLSRNEPNYFRLASRVRTLNPKVRRPILLHNALIYLFISGQEKGELWGGGLN